MILAAAWLVSTIGTAALVGFYPVLPEATGPTPAFAQVGTVSFPELERLVHYTTVRRGVTREHMLTNQTALDAIGRAAGSDRNPCRSGRPPERRPGPLPRGRENGRWARRLGISGIRIREVDITR